MNSLLLVSSIIFTHYHIIARCSNIFYKILFLRGCMTSILNHGTYNQYFKYYDRIAMIETAIIKLFICISCKYYFNIILTSISIFMYLCSKKYCNTFLHIISHICITISNLTFMNMC